MKKVLGLFLLVIMVSGCNGIQVVDNTYGPMGGQYVKIDSDLDYLGNPDVYATSTCVKNCQTLDMSGVKVRSDLFAKSVDGSLAEICVFERRMLTGNSYWMPNKGSTAEFAGKSYAEAFFMITETGDNAYVNAYMNYLNSKGYKLDIEGMAVRFMVRNISRSNKMLMVYGCSLDQLPESIKGDQTKIEQYLTEMFEKRFSAIES